MESNGIVNKLENGKLPMIEAELILVGYEDKSFTDVNGKTVNYTDVNLSTGMQNFIVGCSPDHHLERADLGRPYTCKFFVSKKKIKLIGLFEKK